MIDISEAHDELHVLINPEFCSRRGESECEEGCLSVPGDLRQGRAGPRGLACGRPNEAANLELTADGLLAVCIQHEMDHLEGKVFVDYLSRLKRTRILAASRRSTRRAGGAFPRFPPPFRDLAARRFRRHAGLCRAALAALLDAGLRYPSSDPARPASRARPEAAAQPGEALAWRRGSPSPSPRRCGRPQPRRRCAAGRRRHGRGRLWADPAAGRPRLPRARRVNIHASLLPRWRGAAPIQRAIEAGDTRRHHDHADGRRARHRVP